MGSHGRHSRSPDVDSIRLLSSCEPDSLCAVRPSLGQGSISQCSQQAGSCRAAATGPAALDAAITQEELLCMLNTSCGSFTAPAPHTPHELTWVEPYHVGPFGCEPRSCRQRPVPRTIQIYNHCLAAAQRPFPARRTPPTGPENAVLDHRQQ